MWWSFLRFELKARRTCVLQALAAPALLLLACFLLALRAPHNIPASDDVMAGLWLVALLYLFWTPLCLFERDRQSGLLEQWPLMPIAMGWLFLGKLVAHWLAVALPLLLAMPVAALLLGIHPQRLPEVLTALLPVSVGLIALGGVIAAVSCRRSIRIVITLLSLPPALFLLTLGSKAANEPWHLWLVGGLSLLILPLSCVTGASLLRREAAS